MSKLLMDGVDLLAIGDALYGGGDWSKVSTDCLESYADSDMIEEHERPAVAAELAKRRAT
jgi:hypothetical protein